FLIFESMSTTIKYGLIGGGILSLFLGLYILEVYKSSFYFLWTPAEIIILVLVIFYGIKERKKLNGNSIHFGEAVFTGIKINTIAALIHSAAMYLFFTYNTSVLNDYKKEKIESSIKEMTEMKYAAKDIQQFRDLATKETTPRNIAKNNLLVFLIMGLVFSMVSGAIQRTRITEDRADLPGNK
ncbi:MAG: DUF4199 domain-containing protein, partial [Cytophagaceae bacterium]|nr:DUF4199 domain-containing protein [Cytophagaceae bacterium]